MVSSVYLAFGGDPALNRKRGFVSDDTPWRRVTPFENVDEARIRFLTDVEAVRLVKCCRPEFRHLVQAALLTGARYGELRPLKVRDVSLRTAQVYISQSKSGRPRHIPLNPEGLEVFRDGVAGKTGDDLVFVKHDDQPWGKESPCAAIGRSVSSGDKPWDRLP